MRISTPLILLLGLLSAPVWAQPSDESDLPDQVVIGDETFVLIPGGWSYKSVSQWDHLRDEHPLKRVWVDAFYMAKYEARAKDFARFLNQGGEVPLRLVTDKPLHQSCVVQQDEKGEFFVDRPEPNVPASGLSWIQAVAFTEWMGFRLPTEAEWEKAARGPDDQRVYPWGDERPVKGEHAIFGEPARGEDDGCGRLVPVDQLPKGVSPYGLYNMSGNIREYVADYSPRPDDPRARFHDWFDEGQRNPAQREGTHRILKGGRWADDERGITISYRTIYTQERPFRCNGLRFAVDVDTVRELIASSTEQGDAS